MTVLMTLDRQNCWRSLLIILAGVGFAGARPALAAQGPGPIDSIYDGYAQPNLPNYELSVGSWGVMAVDAEGDTGYHPSIAIDAQGRPHIAYNDWENGDLRYAYWNGDGWVFEVVDGAGTTGGMPSLALDKSDRPHISYHNWDAGDLWYATKKEGQWTLELVDDTGEVGLHSSLKVSASSTVHIAYEDVTPSAMNLKYAYKKSNGAWVVENVDTAGDVGQYASLALTSYGSPQIAYLDFTNKALKHTQRLVLPFNGQVIAFWFTQTVASDWSGFFASMGIDADNTVHIAHQNADDQTLLYAKKASNGSWIHETIDSSDDVGEYASLALDQGGNPHVAYYDAKNKKLKYAKKINGSWSRAFINDTGVESWDTAITLGPNGNPHVAYLNYLPGNLMYARWSGAPSLSWVQETGFGNDGFNPDSGNPYTPFTFRVAYSDPENDPVKTGYPKLRVMNAANNEEIAGSPFELGSYATQTNKILFEKKLWLPAGGYQYFFEAQDRWGVHAMGSPTLAHPGPAVTDIGSLPEGEDQIIAYPNPATGQSISFRLALTQLAPHIEIHVYDVNGELKKSITNEMIVKTNPPIYEYVWDLRDEGGQAIASGVYVYSVNARDEASDNKFKAIKKLAILK